MTTVYVSCWICCPLCNVGASKYYYYNDDDDDDYDYYYDYEHYYEIWNEETRKYTAPPTKEKIIIITVK